GTGVGAVEHEFDKAGASTCSALVGEPDEECVWTECRLGDRKARAGAGAVECELDKAGTSIRGERAVEPADEWGERRHCGPAGSVEHEPDEAGNSTRSERTGDLDDKRVRIHGDQCRDPPVAG